MSRKRRFMVAAAALTIAFACAIAVFLHGQEAYVPPNQVSQTNAERSQMLLTGTGYTFDKEQEKNHNKTEQQREKLQEQTPPPQKQPPQRTSMIRRTPSAGTVASRTGTNGKAKKPTQKNTKKTSATTKATQKTSTTQSTEDKAKKPKIKLSIASGEEVRGKRLDFTVTVTDCKDRNVPVFSESDGSFTVSCNGADLSSTGADSTKTHFRTELKDGQNQIVVTAVDRDGNTNTKTVRFTGITSEAAEVTGTVYVSVQANVLNLGTICEATVEIANGDTAKDVLEILLQQAGITPDFKNGYLAGISKPGLSEGAYVSEDLRAEMEDRHQTEKDPNKQDRNRLKEHDFYDSSGWIYCVNGEFPEKMMGSCRVEDGDELILYFQLAEGIYE